MLTYALPCCVCFQDLKCVLKKAGLEGRDIVFLFNDTQIIHEGLLEDLNNILNAGKLRQCAHAERFGGGCHTAPCSVLLMLHNSCVSGLYEQ